MYCEGSPYLKDTHPWHPLSTAQEICTILFSRAHQNTSRSIIAIMAPIAHPPSPLDRLEKLRQEIEHTYSSFHKRSAPVSKRSSECSYYDSNCSTHRLAAVIIIVAVALMVTSILIMLYVRSRATIAVKLKAQSNLRRFKLEESLEAQREGQQYEGFGGMYGTPPPYTPKQPERAYDTGAKAGRFR
jgi:hypothetical protein